MNNSLACEQREDKLFSGSPSHWFASIGPNPPAHHFAYGISPVAVEGHRAGLYVGNKVGSQAPLCAARASCEVVFDGALHNGEDFRRELGEFLAPSHLNDAELILVAYLKWGDNLLPRLRGSFALIIRDNDRDVFLCLRDPIGTYPLFYTVSAGAVLLSTTADALVKQPHVSGAVNRAAIADLLLDRFPIMEETYFEAIKRIPPGHVLRITKNGQSSYRYWDPAPNGEVKWLEAGEIERFDELFDQALQRCLKLGPAGIYLSGGLDSVSVAAVAAERARANGLPTPWALSMLFPDPDVNEEIVQKGVAARLGLPQVMKPFHEATGEDGLLRGATKLNGFLSSPIINTWLHAYYALACEGTKRGCKTILTGSGGDEWLNISPMLGADLLRQFDLAGFYRLWQSSRRSFRRPEHALFRAMVWTFGLAPLVVPPVHRLVKRHAPWAILARRRLFRPLPTWLAPGAGLRKEIQERWEQRSLRETHSTNSFYITEMKLGLDHPLVSWEIEEWFDFGQLAGARILHPMWDPDLVDFLYRTPPFMLIPEGRTKGLVRSSLARRFPNLGFEQQRKVEGTRFYSALIYQEARRLWDELGGAPTLSRLGVVDEKTLAPSFERFLRLRKNTDAHTVWFILNLESWARAHCQ